MEQKCRWTLVRGGHHLQLRTRYAPGRDAWCCYLNLVGTPDCRLYMKRIGQAGQCDVAVLSLAVLARWSLQTEHILRCIERDEAPRPECLGASRAEWWLGRSVGRNQLQNEMYNSRDRMQTVLHPRSADAHTDAVVEVPCQGSFFVCAAIRGAYGITCRHDNCLVTQSLPPWMKSIFF